MLPKCSPIPIYMHIILIARVHHTHTHQNLIPHALRSCPKRCADRYIYISISRSAFPANYRPRLYTRSNSTIHTHTLELYVCGFFILRARVWRESDSRAKRGLLRARLVTSNLVIIDRLAPNTAQAIEIPRIHHIHITIHHIYDMLPTMRCERVLHVIYYIRI